MKGKLRVCILTQRFQWIPTSLATYKGESMDEWLHSGMNNLFPINYNHRQRGPAAPPLQQVSTTRLDPTPPLLTASEGSQISSNQTPTPTAYLEPSSTLDPFLRRRSMC
ncbi:unnamed protein product [Arctogadus glacialis]